MVTLLRTAEVGRLVGVDPRTVRAWMDMEAVRPGTGLRFVQLPGGERRIPATEVDRLFGTLMTRNAEGKDTA